MHRLARALLVPLVAVLFARGAGAQEVPIDEASRAAVRELGYEGIDDYEAGRYQDAVDKLERAYQVLKAPSITLWSARALERLGRLVEASERYLEATRQPMVGEVSVQQQAVQQATAERELLETRIPRVVFRITGDAGRPVVVSVDGATVPPALMQSPRRLDPGQHVVVARCGDEVLEQRLSLLERETRAVDLKFSVPQPSRSTGARAPSPTHASPPVEARDNPLHTAAIVSFVVGGAGLATGFVAGAFALHEESKLEKVCVDRRCTPAQHANVDHFDLLRLVSTTGFVTAGIGGATGTVLILSAPSSAPSDVRATGVALVITGEL